VDRFAWIEPLGISYYVGVDGINLWFLLLTGLVGTVAVLVSWGLLTGVQRLTRAPTRSSCSRCSPEC